MFGFGSKVEDQNTLTVSKDGFEAMKQELLELREFKKKISKDPYFQELNKHCIELEQRNNSLHQMVSTLNQTIKQLETKLAGAMALEQELLGRLGQFRKQLNEATEKLTLSNDTQTWFKRVSKLVKETEKVTVTIPNPSKEEPIVEDVRVSDKHSDTVTITTTKIKTYA